MDPALTMRAEVHSRLWRSCPAQGTRRSDFGDSGHFCVFPSQPTGALSLCCQGRPCKGSMDADRVFGRRLQMAVSSDALELTPPPERLGAVVYSRGAQSLRIEPVFAARVPQTSGQRCV